MSKYEVNINVWDDQKEKSQSFEASFKYRANERYFIGLSGDVEGEATEYGDSYEAALYALRTNVRARRAALEKLSGLILLAIAEHSKVCEYCLNAKCNKKTEGLVCKFNSNIKEVKSTDTCKYFRLTNELDALRKRNPDFKVSDLFTSDFIR